MDEKRILAFVKVFDREEYADQFVAGNLHLSRLSSFKSLESHDAIARGDKHEGLHGWHQPHCVNISIMGPNGEIKIGPNDLAGPFTVSFNRTGTLHLLCLYAVYVPACDLDQFGKMKIDEGRLDEFQNALKIDDRCREFGRFAVIIKNPNLLLKRVADVLDLTSYGYSGKLVNYFEENTFNGSFSDEDSPFQKRSIFSWQNEFRICVDTNSPGENPLELKISSLEDIIYKIPTSELGTTFRLSLA